MLILITKVKKFLITILEYKNDWVLLIGKSGSGKTTFFNLLFRFW